MVGSKGSKPKSKKKRIGGPAIVSVQVVRNSLIIRKTDGSHHLVAFR